MLNIIINSCLLFVARNSSIQSSLTLNGMDAGVAADDDGFTGYC